MCSVENVLHIKIKQSFKIEYLNYRFISIDYFDRLNYLCVSYKVSSLESYVGLARLIC